MLVVGYQTRDNFPFSSWKFIIIFFVSCMEGEIRNRCSRIKLCYHAIAFFFFLLFFFRILTHTRSNSIPLITRDYSTTEMFPKEHKHLYFLEYIIYIKSLI